MATSRNYIPGNLADRATWMANFAAYIAANFLALGLASADNDVVQAKLTAFADAYTAAQTAGTRSPVTVAVQTATDNDAQATARFYAQLINNNPSTSDEQRAALQITIRTPVPRGRIAAPVTWPVLTMRKVGPLQHWIDWRDSEAPTVKTRSKPYGSLGVQLFQHIGATPPADPAASVFLGNFTRLPIIVDLDGANVGQTAYYYARWYTYRGLEGPLVGPLVGTVSNAT